MQVPFRYNLRSLLVRRLSTLLTMAGVGLSVAVFIIVMALVDGLRGAFVATGCRDNLVILSHGSATEDSSLISMEQFKALKYLPGIRFDQKNGDPDVSPETTIQAFVPRLDGGRDNVILRGVLPVALRVHSGVNIVAGQMFKPGIGEMLLGRQLVGRCRDCQVGSTLHIGRGAWTITGIIAAAGSSFESEAWVDLHDLTKAIHRGEFYSSIHIRCAPGIDQQRLVNRVEHDPTVALHALTETEYYKDQSSVTDQIGALGVIVAVVMGVGAVFAAANTMHAAVSTRSTEIGILQALGFSPGAVFLSFVLESVVLALAGGILGIALTLPMSGFSTTFDNFLTLSAIAFSLRVTPVILIEALIFAAIMGALGGSLPARRAMRSSVIDALKMT